MSNPVMTRAAASAQESAYGRSGVEVPTFGGSTMTVAGTMNRTIALFGVLLLGAAVGWVVLPPLFALGAGLVAFVLAMVASFSKQVNPAVILAYAAFEGVFLAGISSLFETVYPGIVMNAVLATTITAGVMFFAYQQQWIRVTAKFRSAMTFALVGYLVFALVNLVVGMVTDSAGVYGSSFGWLVALIGVGLAAFTLVVDFADIEAAAQLGVPENYEWRFAFGLMVSVVWMYTEILRLLAILRGDD